MAEIHTCLDCKHHSFSDCYLECDMTCRVINDTTICKLWQPENPVRSMKECQEEKDKKIGVKPNVRYFCKNCGREIFWDIVAPSESDFFCSKCGTKINWEGVS